VRRIAAGVIAAAVVFAAAVGVNAASRPAGAAPLVLQSIRTAVGGLGHGDPLSVGQQPAGLAVRDGKVVVTDPWLDAVRTFAVAGLTTSGDETVAAGNGVTGYAGDNGPATAASITLAPLSGTTVHPPGVAIDSHGNVFFADTGNHVVRRIDTNGIVTTIAGNGVAGSEGDNGPATAAHLQSPAGLAVDAFDNVYIADAGAHVVRKVFTGFGVIGKVAGTGTAGRDASTTATSAALDTPTGVAVDGDGNVYVADSANCIVRQVTPSGGISTVAGTGGVCNYVADPSPTASHLNRPQDVAVDDDGDVYVADTRNCIVRKLVVGASPSLTTIAGVTPTGALTPQCGDDASSGAPTAVKLDFPTAVAYDSVSGAVLVGDSGASALANPADPAPVRGRVRMVHGTSATTLAGGPTVGWSGDGGPSTAAELDRPNAVAFDAHGDLYVADSQADVVRKVDGDDGTVTTIAGNGVGGYSGDGGPATSASLNQPTGVAVDGDGNVFVADNLNCVVREVTVADGKIETIAGSGICGTSVDPGNATDARLSDPYAVAVSPLDGFVYVSDSGNHRVRAVDVASGAINTVAGSNDTISPDTTILNEPRGLAFDASGNLYIADADNNRVRKLDHTTSSLSTVAGTRGSPGSSGDGGQATSATLSAPYGVAVGAAGDLFVADRQLSTVRHVDTSGVIRTIAGSAMAPPAFRGDGGPAAGARLNTPLAVAVDGSGGVWIADSFNSRVREVPLATVPSPPLDVAATAGDGRAVVTWSAPASDGGSAVTGFTVTSSPGGRTASVGASARTATVTGLVNGQAYAFTVTATNAIGASEPSAASALVVPVAPTSDQTGTVTTSTVAGAGPGAGAGGDQGYVLVGEDGSVYPFGSAQFKGDLKGKALNAPIIGVAYEPGGSGYWLVAKDGGIFTFGTARFFGSMGGTTLNSAVLGMQVTPSGGGYWLFAGDGGIFSFGDARFFGSMGDHTLNAPVVQMEPTASGAGYWLVASDGGIFTFGSAGFHGSTGAMHLNQPVFDMTSTDTDLGYWLVARDGGVFSFGDAEATFYGSAVGASPPPTKVVGMDSTPDGRGYWIADASGKVYAFGDASSSLGDRLAGPNPTPMVAFASVPPSRG
jgi:sugar lactone lactonase YvrE